MVAGKGKRVVVFFFFPAFVHLGEADCQFPPPAAQAALCSLAGCCFSPPFLRRCLWQGREWGWAKTGLDTGAQPHPAPGLLPAPGEGSLGQRLCFPDSSYVCGSAARAGVPAIASPSTPNDGKRPGNPRGGRQQRAIGAGSGDTPRPAARALGPSSPAAPLRTAGVRAGGGLPALGSAPGRSGPRLTCGGGGAQLRGARGAFSPRRGAAALGAGAAAAGAARTISGGSRLLRGCGGGVRAGGQTRSGEPSAPADPTASPSPLLPPSPARPPPLATGWTRFRAERGGPAARCSAPPPAAAAAASAAAPPGLPPVGAAPGGPRLQPCPGIAPRWRGGDARVDPRVPRPRLGLTPRKANDEGLAPGGGGGGWTAGCLGIVKISNSHSHRLLSFY